MPHSYTQPYIVVGALIVRDGKILLVKENHLPDKGKWNIPAGKLDYGENPNEAVSREVYEETGLKFKPSAILGLHSIHRKDVPGEIKTTHVLRIVYVGKAEGDTDNSHGEEENGQPEISEYKWLSPEDILSMDEALIRYHDLKDYVNDYVSGKSYSLSLITHLVQE
jgi:ADP-ribose pyrophosphatase